MPSFLAPALALAARGFRVLPLWDAGSPRAKMPRLKNWPAHATTDLATIAGWWRSWPDANIGAAMGGDTRLVAIDIDGPEGVASFAELAAGRDTPTRVSLTGSGKGCQRIYRAAAHQDLSKIRNAVQFRPGLDVRATGGQIVVPPSVHPSGRAYEWLDPDAPIAELPDWLYDEIASDDTPAEAAGPADHEPRADPPLATRLAKALVYVAELPAAVSRQGGHNALLVAAAAAYRGHDLPRAEARRVLDIYNARCLPPWTPRELEHKLDAVEAKGEPWGWILDAEAMAESLAAPEPARAAGPISWITGAEVAAPLPPTRWCVPDLQICPGRPTLLAGYGFSGKTLAGQALLVALVAEKPIWTMFAPGEGRVVRHLDYEQGRHATIRRYQRIAVGLGVDLAGLGERLGVAVFPPLYLNDRAAVDAYSRACEGADLVLLDALRGATPGEDENDSKIRTCVDNLTRVSEKTGAAFVVIHHSGKVDRPDQRMAARGSSAIFDGAGCVLVISGEKGENKTVSQVKGPAEAEGNALGDFELVIEDVAAGSNPTAGVRLAAHRPDGRPAEDKFEALVADVLECVAANPGVGKGEIASRIGRNRSDVFAALDVLTRRGDVVNRGTGKRPALFVRAQDPGHLVVGDAD